VILSDKHFRLPCVLVTYFHNSFQALNLKDMAYIPIQFYAKVVYCHCDYHAGGARYFYYYEGRLKSSWPNLITPSRNFVEVR